MTKFEIIATDVDVKKGTKIEEGITYMQEIQEPCTIASFETLEEAKEMLKNYKCDSKEYSGVLGKMIHIKEVYIEKIEYDDDGEFLNTNGICAYAERTKELNQLLQ